MRLPLWLLKQTTVQILAHILGYAEIMFAIAQMAIQEKIAQKQILIISVKENPLKKPWNMLELSSFLVQLLVLFCVHLPFSHKILGVFIVFTLVSKANIADYMDIEERKEVDD